MGIFDGIDVGQILYDSRLTGVKAHARRCRDPFYVVQAAEMGRPGFLKRTSAGPVFTEKPQALTIFATKAEAEEARGAYAAGGEPAGVLKFSVMDVLVKEDVPMEAIAETEEALESADVPEAVLGPGMEAARRLFPTYDTAYVVLAAKAGTTAHWKYVLYRTRNDVGLTDDPSEAHLFSSRSTAQNAVRRVTETFGVGTAAVIRDIDISSPLKMERDAAAKALRGSKVLENMDVVREMHRECAETFRKVRNTHREVFVATALDRGDKGFYLRWNHDGGRGSFTSDPKRARMFGTLEEAEEAARGFYNSNMDCVKIVLRNIPTTLKRCDAAFAEEAARAIHAAHAADRIAESRRKELEYLAPAHEDVFVAVAARYGNPPDIGYLRGLPEKPEYTHDIRRARLYLSNGEAKAAAAGYRRIEPACIIGIAQVPVHRLLRKVSEGNSVLQDGGTETGTIS